MKRTILFVLLCLLLVGCSNKSSSKYDIVGTWQVINSSSGNDLGDKYSEDITHVWYWTFEKNGKMVQSEETKDGGIHSSTSKWSLSGDVITIEDDAYKIIEYNPKTLVIRYDSEYSVYQGKQVHSWLQYKLSR